MSNRRLGIKAKKCLYEGVIVWSTITRTAEAWSKRTAERTVNVFEMKCLRS